jgi:hypothetical protein
MNVPLVSAGFVWQLKWHRKALGGEFVRNEAELVWSAEESGFTFQSDPLTSDFATLGHERNGVFFS